MAPQMMRAPIGGPPRLNKQAGAKPPAPGVAQAMGRGMTR
jgi:hypothetical protein